MSKKTPALKTITFIVPGNDELQIGLPGTFIMNIDSTANLSVSINDGDKIRFNEGDKYRMSEEESFSGFTLYNDTGSAVTVVVGLGRGDIETSGSVTISGTVTTDSALMTLDSKADVEITATTTVQVIAANSSRKKVRITNPISNTAEFRIGDSGAGASNGDILPPGGTWEETTGSAVYAYNPEAGAESLTLVELT